MSRTTRNHPEYDFYIDEEKRGRDQKPRHKPPKQFKRQKRRAERTKAKQDLRQGYEPETTTKHTDVWDWV